MLFIEELYVFFYFSFYAFFARYVKVSKQFRFQLAVYYFHCGIVCWHLDSRRRISYVVESKYVVIFLERIYRCTTISFHLVAFF